MNFNYKEDKRPKRNGWAPGDYMCHCGSCGSAYLGDKRSVTCAECAYKAPDHDEIVKIAKSTVLESFMDYCQRLGERFDGGDLNDKLSDGELSEFWNRLQGARIIVQAQTLRKGMAVELLEDALEKANKRIQELLEANTAYLSRARSAEGALRDHQASKNNSILTDEAKIG